MTMRWWRLLLILSFAAVVAIAVVGDTVEDESDNSEYLASWFTSQDGSWTDRLGLRFKDDCQEDVGIKGIFIWLWAWATRKGQQRSGHCESKQMRCPGTKLTGLQVRYARMERSDRDLYDFKPRCGVSWQEWLGMKFPDREEAADHFQSEASICPQGGGSVTGIQVMRGRNDQRDQDYFNFKLRCGKHWNEQPLGLAFDGLRETRSATCPAGAAIAGLRVHRGFQDWGDLDTYEFQLFCTTPPAGSSKPSSGNGERGGSRKRSSGGRGGAPNRERAEADTVARPSGGGKSAFGSRAADAEAAAEEVRAEMRAASARRAAAPQADEL